MNAGQTRSYPFIFTESGTVNSWLQFFVCLPGDTASGGNWITSGTSASIYLIFAPEAGSFSQSANVATAGVPGGTLAVGTTWQAGGIFGSSALTQLTKTTGATFDITGVQLEASLSPNPFRRPTRDEETERVQRYAWRLAEPAANVNVGFCQGTAAAVQTCKIDLPTTMRVAPGACSPITTGTFKELLAGVAQTWVSPTGGTNTPNSLTITTANTGDAAGNFHMLQGGGGGGVIYCSARL